MIQASELRRLVLKLIATDRDLQYNDIIRGVRELVSNNNFGSFDRRDELKVNEIVWDLVIERILTFGTKTGEPKWPFLRLTDHGKSFISSGEPLFYDPEEYIDNLLKIVPNLDSVISQYALESLRCFRQNLMFASAVMIGAAAERGILLLIEAVRDSEKDTKKRKNLTSLIERPNIPKIFEAIRNTINFQIAQKPIPYKVHEGITEHLLSLYEMIRVQRNDAVHPTHANVSREKGFLSIQAFPVAIESLYRLREWFLKTP